MAATSRHRFRIILLAVFVLGSAAGLYVVTRSQPAVPAAAADPIDTFEELHAYVHANPNDARAQVALGNALFGRKDYPGAIKAYQNALRLQPDDLSARVDMGTAMFYSGDATGAIREYKTALAQDPNHLQANFNLGIVYHSQGHLADAKMAWTKAKSVAKDPDVVRQIDERLKQVAWTSQVK